MTYLRFSHNQINGTLPFNFGTLYPYLNILHLSRNLISGPISSILPSGLYDLSIRGNKMTGDLPSFPFTLQYLYFQYSGYSDNHFTGSLVINTPILISLNNNWITNVLVSDLSQLTTYCDISNNPLLGNLNLINLTMCNTNGLYSADELPRTITTTKSQTKTFLSVFAVPSDILKTITSANRTVVASILSLNSEFYTAFSINNEITSQISTQLDLPNSVVITPEEASPYLVFGAIGVLAFLCVLVVVASYIFKHPTMRRTKYGRKNSYGTLNTVNTAFTK